MRLVITFAFRKKRGTTLTHARDDSTPKSRTLCGIRITPEWMYDSEWGDGPECKLCARLSQMRLDKRHRYTV